MQVTSLAQVAFMKYLYWHFFSHAAPNWHILFATQSSELVMRLHVFWHIPSATLHMHVESSSHVDWAV